MSRCKNHGCLSEGGLRSLIIIWNHTGFRPRLQRTITKPREEIHRQNFDAIVDRTNAFENGNLFGSNKFSTLVRASTYELASPRDRDLDRLQSTLSPWISAPLSANDLQRQWHQGLPPIRTISPSHFFFFFFFFFYFISPLLSMHFIHAKCTRLAIFPSFSSSSETRSCARFFTCTNVSYLTYLRVEKIRGVEKTSYYYAQISHERGRGKNFA